MTEPALSVVIPTHNRAGLLMRLLDSLAVQSLAPYLYEVIVVDNGSTDETGPNVEAAARALPNLRYLLEARPGLHQARHAGLRAARAAIVTFADDDIRAAPTWLEGVVEAFADPGVGLVGGPILPEFEAPPPAWVERLWRKNGWGRALYQYSLLDFGSVDRDIPGTYVFGCNFSVRTELARRAGGFHPDSLPAELMRYRGDGETALARSVEQSGYRVRYAHKASVSHWVSSSRMTMDYLYKRSYAQGISDSYALVRQGGGSLRGRAIAGARWVASLRHLMSRDADGLARALHRGYWEGFRYHQRELVLDPGLRDWVRRTHYMDC